jgi:hypothetical protein
VAAKIFGLASENFKVRPDSQHNMMLALFIKNLFKCNSLKTILLQPEVKTSNKICPDKMSEDFGSLLESGQFRSVAPSVLVP